MTYFFATRDNIEQLEQTFAEVIRSHPPTATPEAQAAAMIHVLGQYFVLTIPVCTAFHAPDHPLARSRCDLPNKHAGPHRWVPQDRFCRFDMGEGDACMLPPGHDGQHS